MAQKRKDGVLTFADLQKEVEKAQAQSGNFKFQVDVDTLIDVPPPTLEQEEAAAKALEDEDSEAFFKAVLGEQFDAVMEAFRKRDGRLFRMFQKNLVEHYDLGEVLA